LKWEDALFHFENKFFNEKESGVILNIGGQIVLECDFNEHGVPMQLSLDTRPMWGFQH
jgi:hypothetical protein